jgi:uncharacterized protein (DUF983 family)
LIAPLVFIHSAQIAEASMGLQNERTAAVGFRRGLARRCPNCGEGALFQGYLKVQPTCEACGHDNSRYRADDGPAYFTVLIIGHALVGPLLALPFVWTWNPLATAALLLPLVGAATLGLLGVAKGAFIGVQWGLRPAPSQ